MMVRIAKAANRLNALHGYSIYKTRRGGGLLRRIFLVRITIDNSDNIVVERSYYDLKKDERDIDEIRDKILRGEIPAIAWPKRGGQTRYTQFEIDFGWVPCHVVMYIDHSDIRFFPHNGSQRHETIIFRKNKIVDNSNNFSNPDIVVYRKNNSFFNFTRFHEYMVKTNILDVITFDNFMLDGNGDRISRRTASDTTFWRYCMDIYVQMKLRNMRFSPNKIEDDCAKNGTEEATPIFSTSDGNDNWLTVVFDPPQDNGGSGGPPPP